MGELDKEHAEGQPAVAQALGAIQRSWLLVAIFLLSGFGLSALITSAQTRVYRATSMLEFDLRAIRPLAEAEESMRGDERGDAKEFYEAQSFIIKSNRVLENVVRDTGLMQDQDFLADLPADPSVHDVAAKLRLAVKVEPIHSGRLIYLHVEDSSPERAQRLCNAIARVYTSQNLDSTVSATSDAAAWLAQQVQHYEKELDKSELALHEFKKKNQLPSTSINEASNMIRVEMTSLQESLSEIKARTEKVRARYTELAKVPESDPDRLPASELLTNEFLQRMRNEFLAARQERKTLLATGKGENYPEVQAADERLRLSRKALLGEIKNIKGAVKRDLDASLREKRGVERLYASAHKRAVELNMKEIEYHRLDRTRDQNEKTYGMLLERTKSADLARMMNVNDIRVVDSAIQPKQPIKPRVPVNLAIGGMLGLLAGAAFALAREQLDRTLKTAIDVEQKLGVPCLGLVPLVQEDGPQPKQPKRTRRQARGTELELTVHKHPRGAMAEAARAVRTNLVFRSPDKPYQRILVSSAAPSEGKTTLACSIAIAFAQSGQSVCIVDCDLRRPRLHRVFGRENMKGVSTVIVGDATLDEAIQPTQVPGLSSLSSGPIPPNPADLLHSARFRTALDELSARFDRVIIDSPPLAAVTDAAIVSKLVDGTVFVVQSFSTSASIAQQGMKALVDVDAEIAGAILNSVDFSRRLFGTYQYYYSKEGYSSEPAPNLQPSE